ncbi:glycosyltransferase family 4 protein [Rhizorhabdus phycosphaerae]|uniref:glycosyltransferase family 4 protein n=1 Tax=Rhizorhabdus phycosphaerae TaxID=2711156 RepID=UPI0013EC34B3|nr:glycosyltransferase family 4 protein [Rhizorhabdus phycosphaerae]
MKLAYLLNSYPMTSTTFIRREIAAIERAGVPVKRFAVRRWSGPLVDPADRAEQERTEYLLSDRIPALLAGLFVEAARNPTGLMRALRHCWGLYRRAGAGLVRHVAYLAQAVRLRRRCAALGIEHLHAHFSTNAAAVALLARLLGGPRYSFTVHGPDELEVLGRNRFVEKARHAEHVVAISRYCRDRLVRHLPGALADRVEILSCGLDLRDYPDEVEAPAPGSTLLCVGRLCPQKGQVDIAPAVAMVRSRYPDIRVLLVGDGEDRSAVERAIVEAGVAEHVRLLGWRSNDEVRRLIVEARALLLPSRAEGLPIVLMEALALCRPVVTTPVAGITELVDEGCGWLIPPGDVGAFADAMASALDCSPERLAALGREGRARVVARHDVDRLAAGLLALFARPRA